MQGLTEKEEKILKFIKQQVQLYNLPPTIREICKKFGFSSTNAAYKYIKSLVKKGYLYTVSSAKKTLSRGIRITHKLTGVPLLGSIKAGKPAFAEENFEEYIDLQKIFPYENVFALRVKGDSMTNAGIFDGDIALISTTHEVKNGDIACVIIDNEATLKRVFFTKTGIKLVAENPVYQPIEIADENKQIVLGKLIGVIRKLK